MMAKRSEPSLSELCSKGSLEEVTESVDELDGDVLFNMLFARSGRFGYTPLHEAVASGNHEVLDYLLTKTSSIPVNIRANNGYTPLHLAAVKDSVECVRVLLKHGADISMIGELQNKLQSLCH